MVPATGYRGVMATHPTRGMRSLPVLFALLLALFGAPSGAGSTPVGTGSIVASGAMSNVASGPISGHVSGATSGLASAPLTRASAPLTGASAPLSGVSPAVDPATPPAAVVRPAAPQPATAQLAVADGARVLATQHAADASPSRAPPAVTA